jgi:anti-sigma factor RsiW
MSDFDSQLVAYVDGELDPIEAAAVERLLARDPELRTRVAEFRETGAILRTACAENFYADGLAHLLLPRRAPVGGGRRRLAWAAAGLLAGVVGFGGGAYWAGRLGPAHDASRREALLSEIAEYHEVYSRETRHLVEVDAEHADDLQTWLGARVNRLVSAPDLSAAGLRFAGGRMLVIDGKAVADFLYTRAEGRPVALCIARAGGAAAGMRVDARGDLRLASWDDGTHRFVVVGELDAASARRIAELAAAQIGG